MPPTPESGRLTIALAGDVMTGRGIDQVLGTPGDPRLHESWVRDARDYVRLAETIHGAIGRGLPGEALWGGVPEHLRRLGVAAFVVNLETAVTAAGTPWPGKGIHYRMHPDNLPCLRAGGIQACTLANNHVLDWGRAGLEDTLRGLQAQGLHTAGAGRDAARAWAPACWTSSDGSVLRLLACATSSSGVPPEWAATAGQSGIAWLPDLSEATACQVAAALAPMAGTRTVVSIHWGENWVAQVPQEHRRFAHRLIDLGAADVVHGHSSHHPLPIEVYRGRLILYGCGDLVNDYEGIDPHGARRADGGAIYAATLASASGELLALRILPLQRRRFRLEAPDTATREWLRSAFGSGAAAWRAEVVTGEPYWELRWSPRA